MPIVDLAEFVHIIDDNHGETGKISLLLLQAVMFAGTAFIDMVYLEAGSFTTRRSARKAFYHRARVCNFTLDLNFLLTSKGSLRF